MGFLEVDNPFEMDFSRANALENLKMCAAAKGSSDQLNHFLEMLAYE